VNGVKAVPEKYLELPKPVTNVKELGKTDTLGVALIAGRSS